MGCRQLPPSGNLPGIPGSAQWSPFEALAKRTHRKSRRLLSVCTCLNTAFDGWIALAGTVSVSAPLLSLRSYEKSGRSAARWPASMLATKLQTVSVTTTMPDARECSEFGMTIRCISPGISVHPRSLAPVPKRAVPADAHAHAAAKVWGTNHERIGWSDERQAKRSRRQEQSAESKCRGESRKRRRRARETVGESKSLSGVRTIELHELVVTRDDCKLGDGGEALAVIAWVDNLHGLFELGRVEAGDGAGVEVVAEGEGEAIKRAPLHVNRMIEKGHNRDERRDADDLGAPGALCGDGSNHPCCPPTLRRAADDPALDLKRRRHGSSGCYGGGLGGGNDSGGAGGDILLGRLHARESSLHHRQPGQPLSLEPWVVKL